MISAIVLILFSHLCDSTHSQNDTSIKGLWTVQKVYPGFSPGMSKQEADSLVGLTMIVSDSLFHFKEWSVSNPQYDVETIRTNHYFPVLKTHNSKIGIDTDHIKLLKVFNQKRLLILDMIWDKENLILVNEGVFIFFRK